MATRTYQAIGVGWQIWIQHEDGTIVLTSDAGKPAGFARNAEDARARFGCTCGPAVDRSGPGGTLVGFEQRFEPHVLMRLKLVSDATYPEHPSLPG